MSQMGQSIRDQNEAAWAADRVERDRNPGPLEPVYFTDPVDVPEGLEDMWLLPSVCFVHSKLNEQNYLSGDEDLDLTLIQVTLTATRLE